MKTILLKYSTFFNQLSFNDFLLKKNLNIKKQFIYVIFFAVALLFSGAVTFGGIKAGAMVLGAFVGLPMLFLCMFNQQFGMGVMLGLGFMVQFAAKYSDAPLGTSLDGLLVLMIFGIMVAQTRKKDWAFAKDPISTWLLIWVYFNLLQGLNPSAESKLAWIFTVRSVAVLNMLYFVACYAFSSLQRIKAMMSWIVFLAGVAMLYGFKQEFGGFTAAEKQWLYADPERFQLFFQWGRMRIFSILSDPMTYGIMMSYMGFFCIIMATAPLSTWKRILSFVTGIMMLWVTAYTGTRTCYVLIPIGFVFYAVMTLTPRVLASIGVCVLLGLGLVFKSSSNPVIYRIQSAFKPNNDASVLLRYHNQQRIRPHIYSHPIGFGLGSTGLWAQRFTPDSWLAKFAHDSYYVRLAVETGWIGLILYMIFIYTVMRRAIYFYNRVRDPIIKTLYLALSTALFILVVANYPQEAIVQLPTSMMVYVFFAAIVRLKDFDEAFQTPPSVAMEKSEK
jgi:hypothetical protein